MCLCSCLCSCFGWLVLPVLGLVLVSPAFFSVLVFDRYKSYSPYDMLESIKKEVKGDLENAFLNLGKLP